MSTDCSFDHQLNDFLNELESEGGVALKHIGQLRNIKPNQEVLALSEKQPEKVLTLAQYVTKLINEEQLEKGREKLASEASTFMKIRQLGLNVDPHILCAIWGVETKYGSVRGSYFTPEALATLAFAGCRRNKFFLRNFAAAIAILQTEVVNPDYFLGSWAGAMGHTQFMPETYLRWGIDISTKDRANIWEDDPQDALASTANYLKHLGWESDQDVLIQVRLSTPQNYYEANTQQKDLIKNWVAKGVEFLEAPCPISQQECAIITPAGKEGPAFAIFANFEILLRYNKSLPYAITVSQLSKELAGGSKINSEWPQADQCLSFAEMELLQTYLVKLGFDTGGIDGLLGPRTTRSIQEFQSAIGEIPDGYPSQHLLNHVRSQASFGP